MLCLILLNLFQIGLKNKVLITFLDFAKAFDLLDKNTLSKIRSIGIKNKLKKLQELFFKSTPNSTYKWSW